MSAALIRMSVAERERYVRWWIDESGLTLAQLRQLAGALWAGPGPHDGPPQDVTRRTTRRLRES